MTEHTLGNRLQRSGLLQVMPWLRSGHWVALSLLLGMAGAGFVASVDSVAFLAVPAGLAGGIAPLLVLDLLCGLQEERLRDQVLVLLVMLNRWCAVREDLIAALERCAAPDSPLKSPLKDHVRDLVVRIRGGMPVEEALALFRRVSDQDGFQDLVIQLSFAIRARGRLADLLDRMERHAVRVMEENRRRRMSTARDRTIVACLIAAAPPAAIAWIGRPGTASAFFLETAVGRWSLLGGAVFWLLSTLLFLRTASPAGGRRERTR